MAKVEFKLKVDGKAEADSVRLAFENLVQSVRDAAKAIDLHGELIVDGIPYALTEVPKPLPPEEAVDITEEPEPAETPTAPV